jgi:hypothetical protein
MGQNESKMSQNGAKMTDFEAEMTDKKKKKKVAMAVAAWQSKNNTYGVIILRKSSRLTCGFFFC